MSALHRSWLADQADAIKYQREMLAEKRRERTKEAE